nr:reverse transcriptase domain-containing protein [Tanacetum cinerariifolium]
MATAQQTLSSSRAPPCRYLTHRLLPPHQRHHHLNTTDPPRPQPPPKGQYSATTHIFAVVTSSPTLTPFGDSDFLLEEVDAFLALKDGPTSPEVRNYLPQVRKELKICEAKTDKSSIDEPPKVELKDLPPHLEYAFLEGDDKLPVIVAKDLSDEEKTALIMVLKSHKRAITWKLFDIKGINPKFCTHKILMEDDFEPAVQHQRKPNVNVIAKLPHPTTVKGIRSFLGHADFYRRFIQDFSKIAQPMTRILEKDTPFLFSNECIEDFQTLKRKLFEAPILISPDWDLPFELMCDASDFVIGVVLGQCQEKHFRPIHYASKTMTEAELNYTTTEKEMLAVVYAFEKFRSYLIMNKSIMYTDHSALKYLFAKKDSKARLFRWIRSSGGVFTAKKPLTFSGLATMDPPEDIMAQTTPPRRFGTLHAIINDRGTHFFNDQFAKVMLKYGVTHRLATAYHPQTSGQVEESNHGLKRILERTRKVQLNELNELHDQAYENSLIYKEKTKRLHDFKIKDRIFNVGDRVLLFNSRLKIFSGKLKTHWSGPFTITHVFPYGTVELSQTDRPNFKVNDHILKHYFGEDIPKMVVFDLQTFPKDQ